MSTRNPLIVYGHVGFDISIMAGNVSQTIGGAAYYAAMAAAANGTLVNLVTVLGADFPKESLRFRRIDVSASSYDDGPSAVFKQTYDDKNEVIAFDGKLNACGNLNPERIPLRSAEPNVVLLTTAPPAQQEHALEWLQSQQHDCFVAIDTTLSYIKEFDALLRRKRFKIDVLFVNGAEYEALSKHSRPYMRTVVKLGSRGASIFEEGVWTNVPAPAIQDVRAITGAGDVLAGAFLAASLNGRSSNEALALAVDFATSFVETGAECFYGNTVGEKNDRR